MKNTKFVFVMLVSLILIIPLVTKAEVTINFQNGYYINNNGIKISEEEYNNFLKIHTPEYIMFLDEAKYSKLITLDYSNVQSETKYVKTIYNPHLFLTSNIEVTEEDYENPIMPLLYTDDDIYENQLKKITLTVVGGNIYNYTTVTNTWKAIPTTRSFDVIGIRGFGVSFRNGSQSGMQIYSIGGKYNYVSYSWNGTNIKKADNGFGISMNLLNDDIDTLQATITCDIKEEATYADIFGSYQHALTNVSLADSQNYTIGGSGLGSVFVFPLSISQKYDGMAGVMLVY